MLFKANKQKKIKIKTTRTDDKIVNIKNNNRGLKLFG